MTFASEAKVGSIPDYSKVKSRLGSAESPKKAFCYGKGGFGSLRLPRETLSFLYKSNYSCYLKYL